jgi:hypothetical protein
MTLLNASCEPGRLGEPFRLARYADYQGTLNKLLWRRMAEPFELPWEPERWSSYWEHLLGFAYQEHSVEALLARVVPVRVRPTVAVEIEPGEVSGLTVTAARAEGLVYPHAVVSMVTFDLTGDATLAEIADAFAALASDPLTTVAGHPARLTAVAGLAARDVRAASDFGEVSLGGLARNFRIFSVLSGTIGDQDPSRARGVTPPTEWAAIRAIASLRPYRDYATASLDFPRLFLSWGSFKPAFANDDAVTYVLANNFKNKKPSNSCYHRNQVLLAAHLLALTPLVIWGAPHLAARDGPVEVDRLVPAAARTVAALAGRGSYRSALTAHLIALLDPDGVTASVAG